MSLPADNSSNKKSDSDKADSGKALAPAGASPVNPFIASVDEAEPSSAAARPFYARLLDYSAHAAIVVGLIGFAWTVSDHVVSRPAAQGAPHAPVAAVQAPDELAQLKAANQKMHDELKVLRASVETLRSAARHDTTPEQVRMLSAGLETMKTSLASTNQTLTQMSGKIDKLQPTKMHDLSERVARLEHQALDPAPTASLSHSADKPEKVVADSAPKPPAKPVQVAKADEQPEATDPSKPEVIAGWVVRDVYQGVALIEGKRGAMEVVPGMTVPGAGVVKSIERHGGSWTVTTSKGQLAYEAMNQRDYRRDSYEGRYYPRYRYGY